MSETEKTTSGFFTRMLNNARPDQDGAEPTEFEKYQKAQKRKRLASRTLALVGIAATIVVAAKYISVPVPEETADSAHPDTETPTD